MRPREHLDRALHQRGMDQAQELERARPLELQHVGLGRAVGQPRVAEVLAAGDRLLLGRRRQRRVDVVDRLAVEPERVARLVVDPAHRPRVLRGQRGPRLGAQEGDRVEAVDPEAHLVAGVDLQRLREERVGRDVLRQARGRLLQRRSGAYAPGRGLGAPGADDREGSRQHQRRPPSTYLHTASSVGGTDGADHTGPTGRAHRPQGRSGILNEADLPEFRCSVLHRRLAGALRRPRDGAARGPSGRARGRSAPSPGAAAAPRARPAPGAARAERPARARPPGSPPPPRRRRGRRRSSGRRPFQAASAPR